MEWYCSRIDDLSQISAEILANCQSTKLAFHGSMGAGKTTLIKHICKQLNVIDVVSSPTFSIVNEYISKLNHTIYHFDFYRIEDIQEAMDIGVDTYFYSNSFCLVEWPSKVKELLPEAFVHIHIHLDGTNRIIKLATNG